MSAPAGVKWMRPLLSDTHPFDIAWESPASKSLALGGCAGDQGLPLRRSIRTSRQAAFWSWLLSMTKLELNALHNFRAIRTAGDSSRLIAARTPMEDEGNSNCALGTDGGAAWTP